MRLGPQGWGWDWLPNLPGVVPPPQESVRDGRVWAQPSCSCTRSAGRDRGAELGIILTTSLLGWGGKMGSESSSPASVVAPVSGANTDVYIHPMFCKTSIPGSCPPQLSWLGMALPSRELGEAKVGSLPSPSSSLTENWGPQPPSSSLLLQTCWVPVLALVSSEHFGQSLESSSTNSILLRLISL